MSSLKLSNTLSIPATEYASQGNAILGIRDAGKTYTAMKVAEELLDNDIPIIVYDPVGIWKNLKVGTGKHKGYPVVVAGGDDSDIKLTMDNAKDIVRAAMRENVSLVIDLYSPELINKSTWIRIVQETVDLLMYENKAYGLRHIFLEEAAEFIPQRLQPQHARVYASLERLARMGRNARLGYTLINQRAEEVNKAILEISEFSLLHRQVGKNSLASIQKWLELLQVDNVKHIIQTLPQLKQGECWVIGMRNKPQLIQVSTKKTFHPDPKKNPSPAEVKKLSIDVTGFVAKLNKQLQPKEDKKISSPVTTSTTNYPAQKKYIDENNALKKQLSDAHSEIYKLKRKIEKVSIYGRKIAEILADEEEFAINLIPQKVKVKNDIPVLKEPAAHVSSDKKLQKCPLAILTFLAQYNDRSFTKAQIGIATCYSPKSSGFQNAISELNTKNLIIKTGAGEDHRVRIKLNTVSDFKDYTGSIEPKEYSIETFKSKLSKCEREIYEVVLFHSSKEYTKEEIAENTRSGYSPTSSGFQNALSTLNTLELIRRQKGFIKLNPDLKNFLD